MLLNNSSVSQWDVEMSARRTGSVSAGCARGLLWAAQEGMHYIAPLCVEQLSRIRTWQHVTGSRHTQAQALWAVQNPASLRGYLHSQLASCKPPCLHHEQPA